MVHGTWALLILSDIDGRVQDEHGGHERHGGRGRGGTKWCMVGVHE